MQFDINKYKEIMKHIDEEEGDDMETVSFSDKDIFGKVKQNGYYTLNGSVEALEKLEKETNKEI